MGLLLEAPAEVTLYNLSGRILASRLFTNPAAVTSLGLSLGLAGAAPSCTVCTETKLTAAAVLAGTGVQVDATC